MASGRTNPRMSAGAVAPLDLPFLVESVNLSDMVDDILAQQLAVGFADINEARTKSNIVRRRTNA